MIWSVSQKSHSFSDLPRSRSGSPECLRCQFWYKNFNRNISQKACLFQELKLIVVGQMWISKYVHDVKISQILFSFSFAFIVGCSLTKNLTSLEYSWIFFDIFLGPLSFDISEKFDINFTQTQVVFYGILGVVFLRKIWH